VIPGLPVLINKLLRNGIGGAPNASTAWYSRGIEVTTSNSRYIDDSRISVRHEDDRLVLREQGVEFRVALQSARSKVKVGTLDTPDLLGEHVLLRSSRKRRETILGTKEIRHATVFPYSPPRSTCGSSSRRRDQSRVFAPDTERG